MTFSRARLVASGIAATSVLAAALFTPTPALAAGTDTELTFSDTGSVQTWTVPVGVTEIYVDMAGAQGGAADNRGAGARLTGTLSVVPGETLNVLVGSQGQNGVANVRGGGGGGGTFIYTTPDQTGILAAAGGGGGAGSDRGGLSASLTTAGVTGGNGGGAGGTDGAGGVEGPSAGGGGGGGLIGSGVDGNRGGQSLAAGAAGGPGRSIPFVGTRGAGGFGGGGGTGSTGGGGGGGYSGGGGGRFADGHGGGGGGGGSFFAGDLTGGSTDNLGRGFVRIFFSSHITSIGPTTAAAGTAITIDGSGLAGATVSIGGQSATVASSTDTQLVVTVPEVSPLPTGPQTIEVSTAGGVVLPAAAAFTFVPRPTVTAISPTTLVQGSAGTVTITGTNFNAATGVFFGATAATSFTIVSDTTITATVPASLRSGSVSTTVVAPGATSAMSAADALTVTPATITLSPSALPGGNTETSYSVQLAASGGTAPYSFSLARGTLPDGITLDAASGLLSGHPSVGGLFALTIDAVDQYGNVVSADYALDVFEPPAPSGELARAGHDADGTVPVTAAALVLAGIALAVRGSIRRRRGPDIASGR